VRLGFKPVILDRMRPTSTGFDRHTARRFDGTSSAHDGIKARYPGTCAVCGKPIRKGVDFVVQHPGLGKYVHELCPV
jgi:hypothetical protein